MSYTIKKSCENIDWSAVCNLIKAAGLATHSLEITQKAFTNSYLTLFVYDQDTLIAVGRAISDGAYQAVIYDIAVLPVYQGKKIGQLLLDELHKDLQGYNIILYASPSKEGFYQKNGYAKMRTGMGRFANQESMRERGFLE